MQLSRASSVLVAALLAGCSGGGGGSGGGQSAGSPAPGPIGTNSIGSGNATVSATITQETVPPFTGAMNTSSFTYTKDALGAISSVTIPASVAGETVTLTPSSGGNF